MYPTTISTKFNPLKHENVDFDSNSEDFSLRTDNFENFWDFWWILLDKWHFDAIRVRSFYTGPLSVSDNVIFIPKSCIFNDLGLF